MYKIVTNIVLSILFAALILQAAAILSFFIS
jgi:hypothetical protein